MVIRRVSGQIASELPPLRGKSMAGWQPMLFLAAASLLLRCYSTVFFAVILPSCRRRAKGFCGEPGIPG
jgi:hypothetical protein